MPVTSGAYEGKGGKYQRNFVSESGDLTQIKATEHIAANTSGPIHVRFLSGKRMALKQKVGYSSVPQKLTVSSVSHVICMYLKC